MSKKPITLLTADIHLRENNPICRKDDYFEAQNRKIRFIKDLSEKNNIPILDGGDLFNNSKSSPFLETWAIKNLPKNFITVPGNHDLLDHSLDQINRSSLGVLEASKIIRVGMGCYKDPIEVPIISDVYKSILIFCFPYGSKFDKNAELEVSENFKEDKYLKIALAHIFAYTTYMDWMSNDAMKVSAINRIAHQFSVIITGHNHSCFISKTSKNIVINPGSLMRSSIKQIDYRPAIFLLFDDLTIETVYLPIEEGVVEKNKIKVNTLSENLENEDVIDEDIELLFKHNLQTYYNKNKTRKEVINFIDRGF